MFNASFDDDAAQHKRVWANSSPRQPVNSSPTDEKQDEQDDRNSTNTHGEPHREIIDGHMVRTR